MLLAYSIPPSLLFACDPTENDLCDLKRYTSKNYNNYTLSIETETGQYLALGPKSGIFINYKRKKAIFRL